MEDLTTTTVEDQNCNTIEAIEAYRDEYALYLEYTFGQLGGYTDAESFDLPDSADDPGWREIWTWIKAAQRQARKLGWAQSPWAGLARCAIDEMKNKLFA